MAYHSWLSLCEEITWQAGRDRVVPAPGSVEAGVGVLYDALPAVVPDGAVSLHGDPRHVLDVEVLETATVVGDRLHPAVRHQGAALHTQLLQDRSAFS